MIPVIDIMLSALIMIIVANLIASFLTGERPMYKKDKPDWIMVIVSVVLIVANVVLIIRLI